MSEPEVITLDAELIEKERQVLRYRQAGLTFDQIATRLGYAYPSGAHAAFKRAMDRIKDETLANEGRALHRARLETALSAIWNKVLAGDLQAIDRMLRILERDSKLYGLDAPIKTETEVTQYDGNLLRERTREIIQTIRAVRESSDSVGDGSSETRAITE
jgi:hypothetical protein